MRPRTPSTSPTRRLQVVASRAWSSGPAIIPRVVLHPEQRVATTQDHRLMELPTKEDGGAQMPAPAVQGAPPPFGLSVSLNGCGEAPGGWVRHRAVTAPFRPLTFHCCPFHGSGRLLSGVHLRAVSTFRVGLVGSARGCRGLSGSSTFLDRSHRVVDQGDTQYGKETTA
jgi:hypothetical protein